MKYVRKSFLMLLIVTIFTITCTGCSTNSDTNTSNDTQNVSDNATTVPTDLDITPEHYDFISDVYSHYHALGYSDEFISALCSIMLVESNGDSAAVEFYYMPDYQDAYVEFLSKKTGCSDEELLEAYHKYGAEILADDTMNECYKDSDKNICVGIGLMLWTGPFGNELLTYRNGDESVDWTDREYQLNFLDTQFAEIGFTPDDFEGMTSIEALSKLCEKYFNLISDNLIARYSDNLTMVDATIASFSSN